MLSAVPSALAVPFVKTLAERNHGVQLADNTVTNVAWKLGHYIGIGRGVDFDVNNPFLKDLQKLAPSAPTIEVRSNHGRCPCCRDTELQRCPPKTSSRVPFNIKRPTGGGMVLETRFRVYTMRAGIQNASFSEEYCPTCALYFLGQWQYEKHDRNTGRGTYGKMTNIKLVAGLSPFKYFVVPREKAWYAVDAQLLQFLTDEIHHSGGTFNSAVLVWSEQHAEITQRCLIPGDDLTLLRTNGVRLEDAWYAHHAARLAGGAASEVKWSFTRRGLESTLLALVPAVRQAHVQRAAEHARECPRCAGELLVLLDGKYGARRFICGGLDGYASMGTLQMELYTGCLQNAPAGRFFCVQCQTARAGQRNLIPQTQILGVAPADAHSGEVSALKYLVRCSDPDNPSEPFDAFLPRAEVSQELLAAYEKSLLPAVGDHGNKKARPAWLKGHRQVTRWLKGQTQSCQGGAGPSRGRGAGARAGARGRAGAAGRRGRGRASAARTRASRPAATGLPRKRKAPAPKRAGRLGPAAACSAPQAASSSARGRGDAAGAKRKQCRGWLALDKQQEQSILACGVDKLQGSDKVRRCTGGIMTAVMSCGWLMDWMELTRGESIEVVYAFALRLHKDSPRTRRGSSLDVARCEDGRISLARERGGNGKQSIRAVLGTSRDARAQPCFAFQTCPFPAAELPLVFAGRSVAGEDAMDLGCVIKWLGYDNACKLLSMARVKKNDFLPWTKSLAEEVRIVLDGFHRDNHTWCLNALPEVDPLHPANEKFLASKNTEACEQLNSWISPRTRMCLEMTRAHFQLHWWISWLTRRSRQDPRGSRDSRASAAAGRGRGRRRRVDRGPAVRDAPRAQLLRPAPPSGFADSVRCPQRLAAAQGGEQAPTLRRRSPEERPRPAGPAPAAARASRLTGDRGSRGRAGDFDGSPAPTPPAQGAAAGPRAVQGARTGD